MPRLSKEQRQFLVEATSRYHESLPDSPAAEHLASRGLMAPSVADQVARFRLGYVTDPMVGHETYRGMLAIPYLRRSTTGEWSVVSIRFRCLDEDCDHRNVHFSGKYSTVAGDSPRMYNTLALIDNDDRIAIAEGEIDAITASICGVPAVGIPGVGSWKPHFRDALLGYETVFILADNDDKGEGLKFAAAVKGELPNGKIVPAEKGHDVNSMVVAHGKKALLERVS